jgi:hypothetical protein
MENCLPIFIAWTYASFNNIRNSKCWGGGPITKYLPKGVTMESFNLAVEYLEAGYDIDVASCFDSCTLESGDVI